MDLAGFLELDRMLENAGFDEPTRTAFWTSDIESWEDTPLGAFLAGKDVKGLIESMVNAHFNVDG